MNNVNQIISNQLNFKEFTEVRKNLLETKNNLVDLSETNLYSFLSLSYDDMKIKYEQEDGKYHMNGNVHRCHLVEDWLRFYNIPQDYKQHIGVSNGVRSSLEVLVKNINFKYRKWYIPQDVYPFYTDLLSKNYVLNCTYETLNLEKDIFYFNENGSLDEGFIEADVILLTYPLKPLGFDGNRKGFDNLKKLISENPDKTFIIDAVYLNKYDVDVKNGLEKNSFDMIDLVSLYDLGNVYLLSSLSKNWSLPKVFGVTFIPQKESFVRDDYKELTVNKDDLKTAYIALNKSEITPEYISEYMFELREKVDKFWKEFFYYSFFDNKIKTKFKNMSVGSSYLYYVDIEPEEFFENNILVIPASTFGGKKGSVISILNKDIS